MADAETQANALRTQLQKIERQIGQLLERILDASVPSVIGAYEGRIQKLEEDKLVLQEKIVDTGRPANSFDASARTALAFLSNPWNLWSSDWFEDKRSVLKLAFSGPLSYARNEGFRTADLALPFKLLGAISSVDKGLVGPEGL